MLVVKVEEWPDGDQSKAEVLAIASADLLEVRQVAVGPDDEHLAWKQVATYAFRAARRNKPELRWTGELPADGDTDWFTPISRALGRCRRRRG